MEAEDHASQRATSRVIVACNKSPKERGHLSGKRRRSCGPIFSSEVVVPYATGEIPEVGDYVKNQWGQLGTVTRVRFAPNEEERICIRQDDEVGSGGLPIFAVGHV